MKHTIKRSYLERGYGQFPYILRRITSTWYQQIPLHSEDLKPLKLDGLYVSQLFQETTKNYEVACQLTLLKYWGSEKSKGNPSDLCLVFNKNKAMYITKDGYLTEDHKIPSGGKLQALDNTFIQMDGEHYIYEFLFK